MEKPAKHLVIVAGDPSGDIHAAQLIREINKIDSAIRFSGVGGQQMQSAGVEIDHDLTKISSIGFFEFFKHLGEIQKTFKLILQKVEAVKPDAVILIDYAGFNLRLAKELKKKNLKVFFYISPQVWASREGRVKAIRRYVDKLFVFFKFEEEFYAKRNVQVEFVGHPLLDSAKPAHSAEDFSRLSGLDPKKLTVGLMPGSRPKEIDLHLPIMIEAARLLSEEYQRLQFIVMKAPHLEMTLFEPHLRNCHFPIRIINGQTYDAINVSQVCVVASGTATLELAIFEKPMVVIYKTSVLTWFLAKMLIKIPYIAMVNIISGKMIVPEYVQFDATPENIVKELQFILKDELKVAAMRAELKMVRFSLGAPGASARAAEKILNLLNNA